MFKRFFITGLLLLALLFGIMLIKTLLTGSLQLKNSYFEGPPREYRSALPRLTQALRFKTVSYDDSGDYPGKIRELDSMYRWMEMSYPLIFKKARVTDISHSRIITVTGSNSQLKPALFLAHLDVVPADAKGWKYPPFAGVVKNDTIYGRGVLDDKVIAIAMLEALENLLYSGKTPQRSIIFAFGHDEETGGETGAKNIGEHFRKMNLKAEFICDEGFGIMEGLVPGTDKPVALIGIAEKGYLSATLTVDLAGGHSSMPKSDNATSVLVNALHRIEHENFLETICQPQQAFFRYLAPETSFAYRFLFSNLWITSPLVKAVLRKNEKTAASIRTTHATTVLKAGDKDNVLPGHAEAIINFRILPGQSLADIKAKLLKAIDDDRVKVTYGTDETEPSKVTPLDGAGWNAIRNTISESFDNTILAPAMVITGTDCKHYTGVSDHIFRFTPLRLNNQNLGGIHGENEKLAVNNFNEAVRYYNLLFSKL